LLLLAVLPVIARADDYTITTNLDNTITITKYTGAGGDVEIPPAINGLPVTVIGDSAFDGFFSMTSVIIPISVTTIEDYAFYDCSALLHITIPDSVITIGADAFEYCSGLTNVTLGNSLAVIGDYAFYECSSLPDITIPATVSNIGYSVFLSCSSLAAILVETENPIYGSANGMLIHMADGQLIQCPEGKTGNITIPAEVVDIADYAFYNCTGLTGLYFEGDAPFLGTDVFEGVTATVYYLAGTDGWGTTYGGLLAVLWNPQIQLGNGFGMGAGGFGFIVEGTNDYTVVVEACTNLLNGVWVPVATNALSGGLFSFIDPQAGSTGSPQATNYSRRFYRLRMP
jgi:hypothetical protein